jgi:hypothetical protein
MFAKPILLAKSVENRSPTPLSVTEVKAIVLRSQGLAENASRFGLGKAAVLKAIQHLGYVQVDPINVLQRAHHHVLWSRVPNYHPDEWTRKQTAQSDSLLFITWCLNQPSGFLKRKVGIRRCSEGLHALPTMRPMEDLPR